MTAAILQAAGGLGLFLLGMSVMTDGLKAMTDQRLRSMLARAAQGPISGVLTGAAATAMVQSSSATTVAAVGFVHSGLLTFPQSLGIIFGANIGTTVTGWLVALVGFKLDLGEVVLPLILVGMLLRLTGRGQRRSIGTTIAGFGLIFVGIASLQVGMSVFEGTVTPDAFPPDTVIGRLTLVLIGVVITLVTQSSSAGVATALTAVHTGTISLGQAAAMVIGMDFGTTVTAAMATIGGNTQARRTGFAHVIYNALTAVGAFALLSPFQLFVAWLGPDGVDPEIALVGFHTIFNTLGVLLVLPFTSRFARSIERLFPDQGNPLVRKLDASLLDSPEIALRVVMATNQEIFHSTCRAILPRLRTPDFELKDEAASIEDAIAQSRHYLEQLRVRSEDGEAMDLYLRASHILDHLDRLTRRVRDQARLSRVRDDEDLSMMTDRLADSVNVLADVEFPISTEVESSLQHANQALKSAMRSYRIHTMRRTADGSLSTKTAMQRMDTARCLRRIGYHCWRIVDHASPELDRDAG